MNPLVQPSESSLFRAGDPIPFHVELVVTIVAALSVRRMRTVRFVHDCIHEQAGDYRAIGITADDCFLHHLIYNNDNATGREGNLFLHAQQAPDLSVSNYVGPLSVDDGHVWVEPRHDRHRA
jgi:hypothetical protein